LKRYKCEIGNVMVSNITKRVSKIIFTE